MNEATFPDERLVRFALGDLTEDERAAVEAHLTASSAAAAFVDRVRRVIEIMLGDRAEAPAAAAVRRVLEAWESSGESSGESSAIGFDAIVGSVRRVVAALVFDSRAQPAIAGFRGSADGYQLAFASEPAEIEVRVTPRKDAESTPWRVRGQVTLREPGRVGEVRLVETTSGAPVARASADEDGQFRIDAGAGAYELVVEAGDAAIVAELALG